MKEPGNKKFTNCIIIQLLLLVGCVGGCLSRLLQQGEEARGKKEKKKIKRKKKETRERKRETRKKKCKRGYQIKIVV